MASTIEQVRRFNRVVSEGIGVLDHHYLGQGRPVGEARVLWEIGRDGVEVRALRARLGLDSGYVSRMLRSLERQGLVRVRSSRDDGRVRHATLTRSGLAERAELDRRANARASRILEPLNGSQSAALLAAMAEVERLIAASLVTFAVEDPSSADAQQCLRQYFSELDARFEEGFDPARSLPITGADMTPPAGVLVIARLRGDAIGCGAIKFGGKAPAHIRRMWVSPSVRGLGVGRRLLNTLEDVAYEHGARQVKLDTHRALTEAIAMYRRAGYVESPPSSAEQYADYWFTKKLAARKARARSAVRASATS